MVTDLSRGEVAAWLHAQPGLKWTVFHEGKPCAVIGAFPTLSGSWSLYGLGTSQYAAHMWEVSKHCRRVVKPAIWAAGGWEITSVVPASHTKTRAWLRMLGGVEGKALPRFGLRGEDAVRFTWLKEEADVLRRRRG